VDACLIPMEESAITVQRLIPRQHRAITPVVIVTIPMAVTTRRQPVTTHPQRGITSQRRAITRSRGSINPHRAITRRRHVTISRAPITGRIRVMAGMAVTVAAGTMTRAAMADATTMATATVAAITTAEAITANPPQKNGASSAVFFMPPKGLEGRRCQRSRYRSVARKGGGHTCSMQKASTCSISSDYLRTLLHLYLRAFVSVCAFVLMFKKLQ
jgi:uncharacterized low-complexity protein